MIAICQSKVEIDIIKKKYKSLFTVLALNLETILFCKNNKINFIFPFDKSNYHQITKKILTKSKNFLDGLNLSSLKYNFLKNDLKAIMRYKVHQVSFLIETINNLNLKNEKIIFTDLYSSSKFFDFDKDYIDIEQTLGILNLNNSEKIETRKKSLLNNSKAFKYKIIGLRYPNDKKVIFNNAGYNFKRFFFYFFKRKIKISIPADNLGIFKKFLFKILGFELYSFKKVEDISNESLIDEIKFKYFYDELDITKILDKELKDCEYYLINLKEKYKAILKYFDDSNFKLVLCNTNRDIGSILFEAANTKKINNIIVSHGTVSESYDEFDKIYKDYIAEGVFLGDSRIKAVQSKLTKKFVKEKEISGKIIETGNLVFSENLQNKNFNKRFILYAVTTKRLPALQLHGVEYFFEFYQNLEILNKTVNNINVPIIVHLHPGAKKNLQDFRKIFKNLIFKTGDISKSLKKSFMTISYSSTVIEDSLYNKIPVLLLDLHKKNYIHFQSSKDPSKMNEALYYMNNISDMEKCIQTIKKSRNINFEDYIFNENSVHNINRLLKNYF